MNKMKQEKKKNAAESLMSTVVWEENCEETKIKRKMKNEL